MVAATLATFGATLGATVLANRLLLRRKSTEPEQEAEEQMGRGRPGKGPSHRSRDAGYETTDANVRVLVGIMVVSVTLIVGGLTAVFLMFARFDRGYQAPNATLTAVQKASIETPLPHLQADPIRDIGAVLMEQTRRLTTYGWNDPDHRSAHIPISRAMQQVVGRPLDGPTQTTVGDGAADVARPAGLNRKGPPP